MSKKLKPYRMQVPEEVVIEGLPGPVKTYTRQEINELIKNHAEKLGWQCNRFAIDAEYLFFESNRNISYMHNHTDNNNYFNSNTEYQEISWQDFLKLTQEDVEVKPKSEGYMNIEYIIEQRLGKDFVLDEAEMSALYQYIKDLQNIFPNTTERNERAELARDLLKIMIAKNGHSFISAESQIECAFYYADEFIKQAGWK